MYFILNTVVFVFLSGYAFVLMLSKPSYVKLSKTERVLLTGREKFLLLTLVTGMVEVGAFSALRLMVWIIMMIAAFVLYRRLAKFNLVVWLYVFYLGWLLIGFLWSPDEFYALRVFAKYFYPFVALLFAATFVHSKEFIFVAMRWMIAVAFFFSVWEGGFMTHVLGQWWTAFGGLFWPMSTLADYLALMSGLAYLMWWRTGEKKYLLIIGWFLLSSVLESVRTGLMGILAVFAMASYLRYRMLALPYIFGVLFAGILSIVFVPQIKQKMFYDPSAIQSVSDLDNVNTTQIDSNGRFAMWEWSLDNFYRGKEWTGSGTGALQETFYSLRHPFGKIKIVHNDYVQMLSDNGLPGLLLYLLSVFSMIFMAMKYTKGRYPEYVRDTAFLVVVFFTGSLVTMMTDNVVNYAFAVHSYPFIFTGILVAYVRIIRKRPKKGRNL